MEWKVFCRSVRIQFDQILRKRITCITYLIIAGFVFANLYMNIQQFANIHYTSQMYDLVKILTLSSWSKYGYFLCTYMPIFCVMPSADSWYEDHQSGMESYLCTRLGKREYWYGKLAAVFFVSFLVFSIPLLLELIISVIIFPLNASGDPSGWPYFISVVETWQYPGYRLLCSHRIIYALVYALQFSLVFSLLAVFNLTISTLKVMKYRVLLYVPIYFILYMISLLKEMMGISFTMYYADIIRMFITEERNNSVYLSIIVGIIAISLLLTEIQIRRKK